MATSIGRLNHYIEFGLMAANNCGQLWAASRPVSGELMVASVVAGSHFITKEEHRMQTLTVRLVIGVAFTLLLAFPARAAEEKIKPKDLPKAVAEAVKARFPRGKISDAAKEEEKGQVVYDIELKQDGRKYETDIREDGTLLEVEKEVAIKDLPKVITKAVEAKYPKASIKEVMEVYKVEGKTETPENYEINIVTNDNKKEEILLTLDGKPFEEK
jgi:putative PepSY-like beta-lactamase-inhibitor